MPWSILSQGTSSVGSLALSLAILTVSDAASFGRFSIAFSFYTVSLNANRSLAGSAMILRSAKSADERAAYARVVLMRTVGLSIVAGALAYPLLSFLGSGTPMALVFALGMPFLLVQDTLRFVYFAAIRPHMAFVLDAVWTGSQLVGFAALYVGGANHPVLFALWWVVACAASCLFSTLERPFAVDRTRALGRLWEERSTLGPLLVEMLALGALDFVTVVSVKLAAGDAVAGYYRAAFLLLAPFNVAVTGILLSAIPRSIIRYANGVPYRVRLALPFLGLGAVSVALIGLGLLVPWRPGGAIAQTIYDSAGWLTLVLALSASCAIGFATLRVEKRLTAAMWTRVLAVPMAGVFVSLLARRQGVHGALAGYSSVLATELLIVATLVLARSKETREGRRREHLASS